MVFSTKDPYADITYADAFIAANYPSYLTAWNLLTDAVKNTHLRGGSDDIDSLNLVGYKTDTTQEREFPRGGDTEAPDKVMRATCILALSRMEKASATLSPSPEVIKETFGDVTFEYSSPAQVFPTDAVTLLKGWVRDNRYFTWGTDGDYSREKSRSQ